MDDLIYNQNHIPREQYRYGFRSSAATGCGWIAVYNALRLLGYRVEKQALIRYFERQLPLIHGNTGTSFWGPAQYFHRWGFSVKMTGGRKEFDQTMEAGDVGILFYFWRSGRKLGSHFVTVYEKEGKFFGLNTYKNSTGPDPFGESLSAYVENRGWFGAILTVVKK